MLLNWASSAVFGLTVKDFFEHRDLLHTSLSLSLECTLEWILVSLWHFFQHGLALCAIEHCLNCKRPTSLGLLPTISLRISWKRQDVVNEYLGGVLSRSCNLVIVRLPVVRPELPQTLEPGPYKTLQKPGSNFYNRNYRNPLEPCNTEKTQNGP